MSYITTYKKKKFNPINCTLDEIDIEDIAHALSLLCRAGGHFPHFYSVAQHSVNCAYEAAARGCSQRIQLGCLLHDASEAYLSDITRPVKPQLPRYLEIEKDLQNKVFSKWFSPTLTEEERNLVFEIDNAMLYREFLDVMGEKLYTDEPTLKSDPTFKFTQFENTEREFLRLFNSLTNTNTYVGVDVMNGKWIAAELTETLATAGAPYNSIEELCRYYSTISEILIDIPIGLPETTHEAKLRPDAQARSFLAVNARKSSVFTVPFRQLLYAQSEKEFWRLNEELGAKSTIFTQGMIPKIKQVDEFIQDHPEWAFRLVESHPECAFQSLNENRGIQHSKKTEDGIRERIAVLSKYVSNIDEFLSPFKKSQYNDLLDALCLAVTAKIGYRPINDSINFDTKGIPMRIVISK